jgi:hypothetical protein
VTLQILVALDLVSAEEATPYLELAGSLVEDRFPGRLAACLRQSPGLPGTQRVRMKRLAGQTSRYLTARLHPGEAALHSIRSWFDKMASGSTRGDQEITFFCAETVAELSLRETARGIQAYTRNALQIARQHFEAAIGYDADNPLPVWNLARLDLVGNRRLDALDRYATLLELLPNAAETLDAEMDAVTDRKPGTLTRFLGPVAQEMSW